MKIGDKEIIHTSSLIIPNGEDAWLSFNVGGWHLNINILFKDAPEGKEKGGIKIESVDDYARVTFFDWNNSLGTATAKPVQIGITNDGQRVTFMAAHWSIGKTNKLDIQFLLGGAE